MGNRIINVGLATPISHYTIELENGQRTFEVHRVQKGIDFKANRQAMKELSPQAYMLYMYMVLNSPNKEWRLTEDKLAAETKLDMNVFETTIDELLAKQYLTQGTIYSGGGVHTKHAYHIWETPEFQPGRRQAE